MYYKSVNRGLTLTAPGFYTMGLAFVLGLLAIGSGYNAIYLSLSLGMAILIISGLLSEKVIRNFRVLEMREVTAEPNTPFVVHLEVKNESDTVFLYGIENLLLTKVPKLSTLNSKIDALMKTTVLVMTPNAKEIVAGECRGLMRGTYCDFKMIHRTVYPFGLLTKFKLSDLKTRISILPAYDENFARELREDFRRRITGKDQEREFHSHRAYTLRDSLRFVNWKKSAGHTQSEWLLKEYESRIDEFGVVLDPDWNSILDANSEEHYELALSVLRTASDVIHEVGRKLVLFNSERHFIVGHQAILQFLVAFPPFSQRKTPPVPENNGIASGNFVVLRLDANLRAHWSEQGMYLRAA